MNDHVDYSKLKTIIYTPSGFYGSEYLWNDPSYAFKHRFQQRGVYINLSGLTEGIDDADKWQYLTNDFDELAKKLNIDCDILPQYDYENCVLGQ